MKTCQLPNCDWCQRLEHWESYRTQKNVCQWCEKVKLNYTPEQYLIKGNMCPSCTSMIIKLVEEKETREKAERLYQKNLRLEKLAKRLEMDMDEETRIDLVNKMEKLYVEIKKEGGEINKNN